MNDCIFCRIVRAEVPSSKVYEDDAILGFHDINPQASVHFLLIPKEHIVSMVQLESRHESVMGRIMVLAQRLAREQGAMDGFRVIVNTGRVGRQDVMHLHVHVLGGETILPHMLVRE